MSEEFFRKLAEIKAKVPEMKKRLPGIAKVEGLRFIADNFAKEGFEASPGSYTPWPDRISDKSKKKGIGEKRGGSLKRSWQQGATASGTQAVFASALPYAEIQNEGGRTPAHKITPRTKKALVTPYGVFKSVQHPGSNIPASPMIGPSGGLDKRIEKKFDEMAAKIF